MIAWWFVASIAKRRPPGGIIIPDTAAEKPQQGEIIAVGPGTRDETGKLTALDVKKGDKVLFGKWSGTEVKIDGQELLIMKESDIMGVVHAGPHGRVADATTDDEAPFFDRRQDRVSSFYPWHSAGRLSLPTCS